MVYTILLYLGWPGRYLPGANKFEGKANLGWICRLWLTNYLGRQNSKRLSFACKFRLQSQSVRSASEGKSFINPHYSIRVFAELPDQPDRFCQFVTSVGGLQQRKNIGRVLSHYAESIYDHGYRLGTPIAVGGGLNWFQMRHRH